MFLFLNGEMYNLNSREPCHFSVPKYVTSNIN